MDSWAKECFLFEGLKKLRLLKICGLTTILLVVIIVLITLTPIKMHGPFDFPGVDKIFHFVSFFCLTLPLSIVGRKWAIWTFLIVMIFGGFIELAQQLSGRIASWADFLANGIGATIGATIAYKFRHWLNGSDDINRDY